MKNYLILFALLFLTKISFSQNFSLELRTDLVEVFIKEEGRLSSVNREELITQFKKVGVQVFPILKLEDNIGVYEIQFPISSTSPTLVPSKVQIDILAYCGRLANVILVGLKVINFSCLIFKHIFCSPLFKIVHYSQIRDNN